MVKLEKIFLGNVAISVKGPKPYSIVQVKDLPEELREGRWGENDFVLGLREGEKFSFEFESFSHPYAIVPSIRGVNPINGLKADPSIISYSRGTICPKDPSHGYLGKGSHCTKCNFTWPGSNFLFSYPSAELKGWRTSKGIVNPFVFTQEKEKDVASVVEGEGVPSPIGFALYKASLTWGAILPRDLGIFWPTPQLTNDHRWPSYQPISPTVYCNSTEYSGNSRDGNYVGAATPEKNSDSYPISDLEAIDENPESFVIIHPVSQEKLENMIKKANSEIRGGPYSGVPTI